MGTHRREFPCQPRKTGEDISDNVTLELIIIIKKKIKIQRETIWVHMHENKMNVKVQTQEI